MENITNDQSSKFQVTVLFFMDEEFMSLVPSHRAYINQLIEKGVLDYYAVSMESQRVWLVINAANKKEVENYLENSPLHKYWAIEIDTLFVFDSQAYRLPALQLN